MFISRENAQSIVDEMKKAIGQDVNIMDETGVILASTNPVRQGQLHQGAVRLLKEGLDSLTVWKDDPEQGVQQGVNLPITGDGATIGVIGITGAPGQVSIFGHIIQRMTEIMLESARRQEQTDLLDRARSLFLDSWLFLDQVDWQELEVRGELLGFDVHAPYTVALLQLSETAGENGAGDGESREMRSGRILGLIRRQLQGNPGHYCTSIRSGIVVLLHRCSRAEADRLLTRICTEIQQRYPVRLRGGVSSPSRSPRDIRRCCMEAKIAASTAENDSGRTVVFYDEASLEFITRSIPGAIRRNLREMIFSGCPDKEREEFTQTIRTYYDCDGDLRRCAERLYVHRNTVQYRIDRIRQKTGHDLRTPKDAMLLYLASQGGV